jgi:hypothetical protein
MDRAIEAAIGADPRILLEPIELTILRTMQAAPDQAVTAKRLCELSTR